MDGEWRDDFRKGFAAYLLNRDEAGRQTAYGLGRRAVESGMGILQVFQLLGQQLKASLAKAEGLTPSQVDAALSFISETMAAYEMILRAYREQVRQLKDANLKLSEKEDELTEMIRIKSEFYTTINHELRNPMTAIHGSLTLLDSGVVGNLPDEAARLVRVAERNSTRLLSLINSVLDLERVRSGSPIARYACLASTIVKRSLDSVRTGAGSQVTLEVESAEGIPYGDEDSLVQVMVNLLANAIKYSPEGGKVTVKAAPEAGWVEFEVKDQGPGVPPGLENTIFKPFGSSESRELQKKPGTGLGLSISKHLVEQQGGSIGVRPNPGGGACFWFRVPAASSREQDAKST